MKILFTFLRYWKLASRYWSLAHVSKTWNKKMLFLINERIPYLCFVPRRTVIKAKYPVKELRHSLRKMKCLTRILREDYYKDTMMEMIFNRFRLETGNLLGSQNHLGLVGQESNSKEIQNVPWKVQRLVTAWYIKILKLSTTSTFIHLQAQTRMTRILMVMRLMTTIMLTRLMKPKIADSDNDNDNEMIMITVSIIHQVIRTDFEFPLISMLQVIKVMQFLDFRWIWLDGGLALSDEYEDEPDAGIVGCENEASSANIKSIDFLQSNSESNHDELLKYTTVETGENY